MNVASVDAHGQPTVGGTIATRGSSVCANGSGAPWIYPTVTLPPPNHLRILPFADTTCYPLTCGGFYRPVYTIMRPSPTARMRSPFETCCRFAFAFRMHVLVTFRRIVVVRCGLLRRSTSYPHCAATPRAHRGAFLWILPAACYWRLPSPAPVR